VPDFGAFLVKSGKLSEGAWTRASEARRETHQSLANTLSGLGLFSETEMAKVFADYYDLDLVSNDDWPIEALDLEDTNPSFFKACGVLPALETKDTLTAVVADPTNLYAQEALAFAVRKKTILKVGTLRDIEAAIDALYFPDEANLENTDNLDLADDIDRLKELASDAPVIRFVDRMIDDALNRRASDIHIEPHSGSLKIRFRVDGVLSELPPPPKDMAAPIVSRIKIMSSIDIAERRLPQDGRMRIRAHGKEIDFRVSTSPTALGEGVVLRLLDKGAVALDFSKLGFDAEIERPFKQSLGEPDGIILVTGPTGSGKTTTLYTGLDMLNTSERKILTAEDPVEYVMEGLGQVQVDTKIGKNFATLLRSFLRQDPDVIMVGEIRDAETSSIAIQASLTGHLVLSTLHTNSAAATIARLIDMGVEDYLLASTLKLIMAQRLVRTLCNKCKKSDTVSPELLRQFGLPNDTVCYAQNGCQECNNTGYQGRSMIAEALKITPAIEKAIIASKSTREIEAIARQEGMRTLFEHGAEKIRSGQTSFAEVLRVTREKSL
jgi:general secretion pathway protein E